MIFRNRVAKTKLVEQLTLVTLQTAHHGSTSPRFASAERNHGSRPISTDFCNKIGTFRKCCDVRFTAVIGGKADMAGPVAGTTRSRMTRNGRWVGTQIGIVVLPRASTSA